MISRSRRATMRVSAIVVSSGSARHRCRRARARRATARASNRRLQLPQRLPQRRLQTVGRQVAHQQGALGSEQRLGQPVEDVRAVEGLLHRRRDRRGKVAQAARGQPLQGRHQAVHAASAPAMQAAAVALHGEAVEGLGEERSRALLDGMGLVQDDPVKRRQHRGAVVADAGQARRQIGKQQVVIDDQQPRGGGLAPHPVHEAAVAKRAAHPVAEVGFGADPRPDRLARVERAGRCGCRCSSWPPSRRSRRARGSRRGRDLLLRPGPLRASWGTRSCAGP